MSDRETVTAADAPAAIGPYSHAVRHGDALYCSGALPLDPASGELVEDSLGAATGQALRNLAAVCEAAGTRLGEALRMTIYTTELEGFAEINEAYGAFFPSEPPARVAIGVAALPKGARVEIDAVVAIPR
ncbi:MAG: RidA family protein [Actinobacteria bacterium]|nr:RidA family protein [Actinomycetota bacterium]